MQLLQFDQTRPSRDKQLNRRQLSSMLKASGFNGGPQQSLGDLLQVLALVHPPSIEFVTEFVRHLARELVQADDDWA